MAESTSTTTSKVVSFSTAATKPSGFCQCGTVKTVISNSFAIKDPNGMGTQPVLSTMGMKTGVPQPKIISPKVSTRLPDRLVTLPGCPIVGTTGVTNTSAIRTSTPAYYLHNYRPTSSSGYMHPVYMPYRQPLILSPLDQLGNTVLDLSEGSYNQARNHQSAATSETTLAYTVLSASAVSPNTNNGRVGKEVQAVVKTNLEKGSSIPITADDSNSNQQSMKSVIANQRRLISQLVKIIVKDKLEKADPKYSREPDVHARGTSNRNKNAVCDKLNDMGKSLKQRFSSMEEVDDKFQDADIDNTAESFQTCKQESVECTLETYFSLSKPEQNCLMHDEKPRSYQENLKEKGKWKQSDIKLLELGRKTMELLSPDGRGGLNTLRSEFSKRLESLKEELDVSDAKNGKRNAALQATEGAFMAESSQNKVEPSSGQSLALSKLERKLDVLSAFSETSAQKRVADNDVIVIEEDDGDACSTSTTVNECQLQDIESFATSDRGPILGSINHPLSSGKGKRRKKLSDSSYTPAKVKEEYFIERRCRRRSPRKRLKTTPSRAYIRRAASKQATKRITNLLREPDSEFSPLSDSCDSDTDEGEEKRKARRKLLPPDLDSTIECHHVIDVIEESRKDANQLTNDDELTTLIGNETIFDDPDCSVCLDASGPIYLPATAKEGCQDDVALTWHIPRSTASSTPLPSFQDAPSLTHSSFQPGNDVFKLGHEHSSYGPIDLTSHRCEPLDLTSMTDRMSHQNHSDRLSYDTVPLGAVQDPQSSPMDLRITHTQLLKNKVEGETGDKNTKLQESLVWATRRDNANEFTSTVETNLITSSQNTSRYEPDNCIPQNNNNAFITLNWQTSEPIISQAASPVWDDVLPRLDHVREQSLAGDDEKLPGDQHVAAVYGSCDGVNAVNDLNIAERTDSDSWEPTESQTRERNLVESDFSTTSPAENSLERWLCRKRRFPNSIFSIARGHGIGFLRPGGLQHLRAECGVVATTKALRKVSRAKSIWKKNADSGKMVDNIARGSRKRGNRNQIHKDRVTPTLTNMPAVLPEDSSRDDESSDGSGARAKTKKLRKRRDLRRSSLNKIQNVKRSERHSDCTTSSWEGEFPFETATVTTESSEAAVISESSPSLHVWKDDLPDMTELRMPYSSENSPSIVKDRNTTPGQSLHSSDSAQERELSKELCRANIKIIEKDLFKIRRKLNEESKVDENGASERELGKSCTSRCIYNEIDQVLIGDKYSHPSPAKTTKDMKDLDPLVKKEVNVEENPPFPVENSEKMVSSEVEDNEAISSLYSQHLPAECVVNVSPLKYRRSGSKWVAKDSLRTPGRSPLRKTFVRTQDCYTLRDTTDEENAAMRRQSSDMKNRETESEISDFSAKSCEINVAEWTMVPRRACSEAKQKISRLAKPFAGKTHKKGISSRNNLKTT